MLIINADDFGLDKNTNQAIIKCFEKGFCSSTSLMSNMNGFDEAVQLAHEKKMLDYIGLHLVLQDGLALTEEIKKFSRFCDKNGQLIFSRKRPTLFLLGSEKKALAKEIKAQIKKCRDAGIVLTHIDSHYHSHIEWAIANVLIPVVKQENIPFIRLARNCGPGLSLFLQKKTYKSVFNQRLKRNGLAKTKYFGSAQDYIFQKNQVESKEKIESFEIMIHPRLDRHGILTDNATNKPLKELMKKIPYKKAVSFRRVNLIT